MGVCKVACLCVYCVIVGLCSCVVSHKNTSGAGLAGTAFLAGAVGGADHARSGKDSRVRSLIWINKAGGHCRGRVGEGGLGGCISKRRSAGAGKLSLDRLIHWCLSSESRRRVTRRFQRH